MCLFYMNLSPAEAANITISEAWSPPALAGSKAQAAFMTITNSSATPDVLESVTSPQYAKVEMHTHEKVGDVMRMFRVEQIGVPAHGAVTLAPGGLHLMLFGVKAALKPGDSIDFTLHFRRGGEVKIKAEIRQDSPAILDAPEEHQH